MNAQEQTSQWNLGGIITSCINFLQTGRISLASVALNIMTCFSCGVMRKTSWTSLRISGSKKCKEINEMLKLDSDN